jgi:hypothetical protein
VRCSSLVDWPVYPRLQRTMQAPTDARNAGRHGLLLSWKANSTAVSRPRNRISPNLVS